MRTRLAAGGCTLGEPSAAEGATATSADEEASVTEAAGAEAAAAAAAAAEPENSLSRKPPPLPPVGEAAGEATGGTDADELAVASFVVAAPATF